jgi:DNA helicase II / ATP-dependent DNA helicase PcrA
MSDSPGDTTVFLGLSCDTPSIEPDSELSSIVEDETQCLERVLDHIVNKKSRLPAKASDAFSNYDVQLLALRDELSTARQEDMPPLLEQMERLQSLADQRRKDQSQGTIDPRSPYFGRLVLDENQRRREVLIGRSTYLDTQSGIRVVDWRDAPVSRLYYRYQEGDEYCENFGGREIDGAVITRRSVTITDARLHRIGCPQGVFTQGPNGVWRRLAASSARLRGGEGSAIRPDAYSRGTLGTREPTLSDDKSLREITALIDPQQFDLITRPDSGLVVIQGGAGSGKTTIGLHRLAYLAYQDQRRFRSDRICVIVFNNALCRYIAQVLPSLGLEGIGIRTYTEFATKLRISHFDGLPTQHCTDTPNSVVRLKKHPAMLRLIEAYVSEQCADFESQLQTILSRGSLDERVKTLNSVWTSSARRPLRHRYYQIRAHVGRHPDLFNLDLRVAIERVVNAALRRSRDVIGAWAEILTDLPRLQNAFDARAPGDFNHFDLARAHEWCANRCARIMNELDHDRDDNDGPSWRGRQFDRDDDSEDSDDDDRSLGVDGRQLEESTTLDHEDDTLLLRLHQRLKGPLLRSPKSKDALVYEHMLIDEAQDYSPVELAFLLDLLSESRSVTLAGDTAQRLLMDNGFTDWRTVLADLGLSSVEVEPLKVGYRSTQEITNLAYDVLGPLAPTDKGISLRSGAPVELFRFAHLGDAAGFLAEQLRTLMQTEPRASVAVIARYSEQADAVFEVLEKGEVPKLRRISDQDFPFKPGVDVTDVSQVKGLEFDYVIVVEVNTDTFPERAEARHLLHIAMTRAAHQLWLTATGEPSKLLPLELRERSI